MPCSTTGRCTTVRHLLELDAAQWILCFNPLCGALMRVHVEPNKPPQHELLTIRIRCPGRREAIVLDFLLAIGSLTSAANCTILLQSAGQIGQCMMQVSAKHGRNYSTCMMKFPAFILRRKTLILNGDTLFTTSTADVIQRIFLLLSTFGE